MLRVQSIGQAQHKCSVRFFRAPVDRQRLDLMPRPFQTSDMAHTYMKFDFGSDEETAQQARHKLDVWKQAFRLDKKLQYKLDRGEEPEADFVSAEQLGESEPPETDAKGKAVEKSRGKSKAEPKGKHKAAKEESKDAGKSHKKESVASNGANVTLLVRLYFSSHEKLSEQRWFDRIPSEEPFKSATPQVIRQGDPEFAESEKHFSDLG
jgi:hypothetical protein